MDKPKTLQQGFTLIEVMIAMTIFTMLSLLAYQILSASIKNSELAQEHTARLNEIQSTFSQMERDFTQIIPRQNSTGEPLLSASKTSLSFTSLSNINATTPLAGSDLIQVVWKFTDHTLSRTVQPLPSLSAIDTLHANEMLSNITSVQWQFYKDEWLPAWSTPDAFPKAVEVIVTLPDIGEIRRTFRLPDNLEKPSDTPDTTTEQLINNGPIATPALETTAGDNSQ